MRPSLLVSLLVLSFLISEAQGIRLKKEFLSVEHHKIHEGTLRQTSNGGVGEVIICKDGHCKGNSRKLLTKTTSSASSTTTTSKIDKNGEKKPDSTIKGKSGNEHPSGRNKENFSVNSSPVSDQEATPKGYPDILDIAGMDYSPARRKPPIHN